MARWSLTTTRRSSYWPGKAVSHAEAGADVVAPSDMMEVAWRRFPAALNLGGFDGTPIMSYAAKFASAYYGPFRDAAESAPQFGDRRSYQMDVPTRRRRYVKWRSTCARGRTS
ncbi:MAG: hypothetical protein CM1200mP29_02940 [Verrucomicrobiota bacterium]|nr:MAG: hypothetical protein CM1200mP29_02940 [Verrucomicrobiota bacterium]